MLLVSEGEVSEYQGSLEDYQRLLRERRNQRSPRDDASPGNLDRRQKRQQAAALRQQLQPQKKVVKQLERNLQTTEASLQEVETALADELIYQADRSEELQALLKQQGELRKRQQQLEEEWLEASEALEALEQELGN